MSTRPCRLDHVNQREGHVRQPGRRAPRRFHPPGRAGYDLPVMALPHEVAACTTLEVASTKAARGRGRNGAEDDAKPFALMNAGGPDASASREAQVASASDQNLPFYGG
jgi:hypothetical protein